MRQSYISGGKVHTLDSVHQHARDAFERKFDLLDAGQMAEVFHEAYEGKKGVSRWGVFTFEGKVMPSMKRGYGLKKLRRQERQERKAPRLTR